MFHYFSWKIVNFKDYKILKNDSFWINIHYSWTQTEWDFFLHPIIDDNHHTVYYLCFDNTSQLDIFHRLTKISGIGAKTWCFISTAYEVEEIKKAIEENNVKFFTNIPSIWPKTAKKIIIELKDKLSLDELDKIDENELLRNKIINSISSLGYPKQKVEKILKTYKWDLSNTQQVIKDILKNL